MGLRKGLFVVFEGGVKQNQKLSGHRCHGHLAGFACGAQALVKSFEDEVVANKEGALPHAPESDGCYLGLIQDFCEYLSKTRRFMTVEVGQSPDSAHNDSSPLPHDKESDDFHRRLNGFFRPSCG
ncbi:hypothetical protein WJU23_10100 [Prosthecobacter sp. SYSU 5D2]